MVHSVALQRETEARASYEATWAGIDKADRPAAQKITDKELAGLFFAPDPDEVVKVVWVTGLEDVQKAVEESIPTTQQEPEKPLQEVL